jgi:Leucine-rich repeat (LRR) protein
MGRKLETIEEITSEMMRLQSLLPARPSPEELQLAQQNLSKVDVNLPAKLEELFLQARPAGVPPPIFRAFQEMCEDVLRTHAQVDKQIAMATIEIERQHSHYGALLQRVKIVASHPLSKTGMGHAVGPERKFHGNPLVDGKLSSLPMVSEDSVITQIWPETLEQKIQPLKNRSLRFSSQETTAKSAATTNRDIALDGDGVRGARVFSQQLMRTLDRAVAKKSEVLDLSNMSLSWLPESIGLVMNLTSLDLSGNELQEVPESIGELARLVLLDVQSNQLKRLPEALGCLTNLATLNIQKNSIEELPWTIGLCTSLVELNADFNKLKALPEAMGHLVSLQRISVHLNSLRSLPTTISSLTNLTQLDVHFNQLETVPESLCSLPNLTNLDLSSNFTELKELPKSIGRLQSLREVDISFNHITELPASFVLLTGLQKLTLDGNPLRMPPLQIAQQGKEAIFNYMNDMLQHLEAEEKVRSRKMGMASMMTVFKKNKIANFRVKDDPDLSIKA